MTHGRNDLSRLMTKPTKWHVRPAKTQISLGIRPVWSASVLCAQWAARTQAFFMPTAKTLIRLGGCPGWSESLLGAHAILLVWVRGGSLVLLGQIDLPSGDKADTTWQKWLMAEELPTFRHQVVLVTRDFCPRPGAPDVSASRRFGTKSLNTPRRFGTKTFRHQNISNKMDGWME